MLKVMKSMFSGLCQYAPGSKKEICVPGFLISRDEYDGEDNGLSRRLRLQENFSILSSLPCVERRDIPLLLPILRQVLKRKPVMETTYNIVKEAFHELYILVSGLLYLWRQLKQYMNKVYMYENPKNPSYSKMEIEFLDLYEEIVKLVHPTLIIGSNWKKFEGSCDEKDFDFCLGKALRGKTICRQLYILREEERGIIMRDVLDVLGEHHKIIQSLKEENYETVGYARESPGKEDIRKRLENLQSMVKLLSKNSKCDQVFVSPESKCSTSINNRDENSSFLGNTTDMLGYFTTSNNKICLVVLYYAGLCSRGSMVRFLCRSRARSYYRVVNERNEFETI